MNFRRFIRSLALVAILGLSLPSAQAATSAACEHLSDPLQILRFKEPLSKLREFRKGEPDALIEKIAAQDARGYLFRIQGLLRIYEGIYESDVKALRKEVKVSEDVIGKYTEKKEYYEWAMKVGAPKLVLRHMKKIMEAARGDLREHLPELFKTLRKVEAEIREIDWESANADRESVIREIRSELKDYAKLDYDYSDLQGGIHELRRNLRWILIYIQALDGLIILEKGAGKLNEYSYLETHPIADSKFSQVPPNPNVKNPVNVPVTYFLALSKVVQEVGVIKSSGENVEALAHSYYESGAARSRAHAHQLAIRLASKQPDYVPDTEKAAKRVGKELERTDLLKKLRKWLKNEL